VQRVTTVAERASSSAMRTRRVLAFFFVMAFAAVVLGHYHDRFWWPPDDGAHAHRADRVLMGEVLHRDIQDLHAGYANFVNAASFRLFGDDLVSLRFPLVAMAFAQSVLLFLLFLPRGVLAATAASASMTALSLVQFLNPTANWYCLFLFVLIVCVLAWLPRESRWRLETLGFLVVTILLFRQLTGVIVAIGVLTYLLCEAPGQARGKDRLMARALIALMAGGLALYLGAKTDPFAILIFGLWPLGCLVWAWSRAAPANGEVLRLTLRLGLGGVVAAAPLVLYHLFHGSMAAMFDDTVLAALSLTEFGFIRNYGYLVFLFHGLGQLFSAETAAGVLNGLFWAVLPLLATANGFLVARSLVRTASAGPLVHPLPFLAVFYALVSVHYQIPIYLFYSSAVSLAGLLWMTAGGAPWGRYLPVGLAGALSAIGLYYHAGQPLSRGLWGMITAQQIPLVESGGLNRASLWMEAADAALYTYFVEVVEREVPRDEAIFALPMNPELYFLTRRRNPFRFSNSALGVQSDEELTAVLDRLATEPPKLVFYRPDDKYNTAYTAKIVDFVRERYDPLDIRGGFEIYRYPATAEENAVARDRTDHAPADR
jgi:hypothetical protein